MNRLIMISGASAGFGAAIARKFVSSGWRALLVARRIDRLKELAKELGERNALPVELDVRDRISVLQTVDGLGPEWSGIDCLVNNAGLALGLDPCWSADLDDWDTMIDTNVKGLTYLTRAVLPGMVNINRMEMMPTAQSFGPLPVSRCSE